MKEILVADLGIAVIGFMVSVLVPRCQLPWMRPPNRALEKKINLR